MSLNRKTILASVDRQLRESLAETGEVRPLGEIVPRVARDIRSQSVMATRPSTGILPVEKVAAFVGGHLDPKESAEICDAVMFDNSVLAEIIAAVRATRTSEQQRSPLPAALSTRLIALGSGSRATTTPDSNGTGENERVTRHAEPRAESASLTISRDVGDRPGTDAFGSRSETPSSARSNGASPKSRNQFRIAVGLFAIAATIAAAIVLLGRRQDEKPDQSTVVHSDMHQEVMQPDSQPTAIPEEVVPRQKQSPQAPVNSIVESPSPDSPSSQDDIDGQTPPRESVTDPMTRQSPGDAEEAIVEKTLRPTIEIVPPSDPEVPRITAAPRLADLRWVEVSGVLARRNPPSDESVSRRIPTWSRIQPGGTSNPSPTSAQATRGIGLRTLPFSRAGAELAGGGRLVIAGDTGLQIARRTTDALVDLDLMYGSVALVGFAEGTVVNVQQGNRTTATLRWHSKASAVVNRQAAGLQVQVDRGEIAINDTPVNDKSVRLDGDMTIHWIASPKRLPRWVTRPEPSSSVERTILAQIADTDDLTASLNQKIAALASSPTLSREESRVLTKLASWQAAMAGPNLIRLAGNRVPAVRLAAIQRLSQLSETDPRYLRTWNFIRRSTNNPQRSDQIREWFRLVRTGTRPNAAQLEQMLGGLSAQSISGRAISDFILRQYIRNAPPFDPTWTGQTLQRAVNIYRQRAGVPVDRLRPNAAATVAP